MRFLLLTSLLFCQPLLLAQDGDVDNFNELEFGDDNFSLEGATGITPEANAGGDNMFGVDDLPEIPEASGEGIEFGDDPAAKVPQQYELNLSNDGIGGNVPETPAPPVKKTPRPPANRGAKTVPAARPPAAAAKPPPVAAKPPAPANVTAVPAATLPSNIVNEPAAEDIPLVPVNVQNTAEATPPIQPVAPPVQVPPVQPPVQAGDGQVQAEAPVAAPVDGPIIPEYQEDVLPADAQVQVPDAGNPPNEFAEDNPPASAEPVVPMNDFSGVPYVPGTRRVMAVGEAPERYLVEEGDTLYDVCDQLLDEPDYWPKLWALNPGIKNPHFIFPGMQLSFYPGDETTPPYLEVVTEDDIIPVETGGVDEKDLLSADVGQLVVEDDLIPAVEVIQAARGEEFDDVEFKTDFETYGEKYRTNTVRVDIPAFFFKEETDVLGQVVSGPYGQINAKAGERVVLEKFSDLQLGSSFTIVRPSGMVRNKDGEEVGYRYEYVAQVQVISGTDDGDYMIAAISRSRLGVRPDDQVVSYLSTIRSFNTSDLVFSDAATPASVVGFDYPDSILGGEGNMVFIDGEFGAGTTVPVYQRLDERIKRMLNRDLPAITTRIGIIKIIDQVGSASLGVIIKSSLDVRVGDRLSSG